MSNFTSKVKSNFQLIFTKNTKLSKKMQRKKKRIRSRYIGLGLVDLQIVLTILFFIMIFILDMIPIKYVLTIALILFIIAAYNYISQYTKLHIVGKILAVLLSVVMFMGSLYIGKTTGMLSSITHGNKRTDHISIIVNATDSAQVLADVKDYSFAYNRIADKTNTAKAIDEINSKLGSAINTDTTYNNWSDLVNGLYNNNVQAIIMNESYRASIEELYTDFASRTRVIETIELESEIENNDVNKNLSRDAFVIYIGGNDGYSNTIGTSNGRNDVNILAVCNPKTKEMLLVTTPRDYYVEVETLTDYGTYPDKLTHAGQFGIDASMATLSNLYNVPVDYFVRVNFTGTMKIVDALGGITINSDVAFTTSSNTSDTTYTFKVGENECDGKKTLAFCRERYAFSNGDNQRGINQMAAIKGMVAKATSPSILTNYLSVMDSVSSFIATSLDSKDISKLVKGTINDSATWNIQSYNTTGISGPSKNSAYFGLVGMSVVHKDDTSVALASELIKKYLDGEEFNVDEFVNSYMAEHATTSE